MNTDIYNKEVPSGCLGCAILKGEYVPPAGVVYKTDHFLVNQDCEIPIAGFMIISSNRHIQSIDEFTEEEQTDFIKLISKLRKGMRELLNIEYVDIVMVERGEHHFHIWLLPVSEEMEEKLGTGTKAIKPIMNYAKENMKTPKNIKKVEEGVKKLREYLKQNL